jgi:hypothetical protein
LAHSEEAVPNVPGCESLEERPMRSVIGGTYRAEKNGSAVAKRDHLFELLGV